MLGPTMDGLSVLFPLPQADFYKIGNAHGWLVKSAKAPDVAYQLSGRLYMAKSGWLLLSVPNALVRGVFDAITAPGVELPLAGVMNVPNVDKELLNAHISVMTAEEVKRIGADNINERGQSFKYSLGHVQELTPGNIDGVSKLWAIQVSTPSLAALRKSYGLSATPKNEPFHITVAVRRTNVLGNNSVSKCYEMSAQTPNEPTFCNPTSRGELKAAADTSPIEFDKWHGKAFKIVTTPPGKSRARSLSGTEDGPPIADEPGRVSIVTPENGDSWNWPAAPQETINNFRSNWGNIQGGIGGYKMEQIRRGMAAQTPTQPAQPASAPSPTAAMPPPTPPPPPTSPPPPPPPQPISASPQKAAAAATTTYECNCSGRCTCPPNCICKKSCCAKDKTAAHEGAPWDTPPDKLPWRERVEVYAHDPKGRIYGGIWNTDKSFAVPGGGIDPGEDPGQAALRELEEETGIKAVNPRVLPIAPVDNAWSDKHRQEKQRNFAGSRTHFVAVDILNKMRRKNLDKWDATKRKMYDPTAAEQMMANHTNFMAPSVAAGRLAALRHIIANAAKKTAAADPATTILVSGHSGAGKSTLSKALAEKLKLPLFQVDAHPEQKAFFDANKDGQETVEGSPAYEEFQKLRKRTAEETLAQVNGPAIVEGAQLAGLSPEQLAAYKTRIFVHTPLKQLLKQRLERQRVRQIAKGREWTPELAAKKQQIGRSVYDVQNQLMQQYAKLPDTLKYTTRKNTVDEIIAKLTAKAAAADILPGAAANGMPDSKFNKKHLAAGAANEREHTTNDQVATEIAKDHLHEDPAHYNKEKLTSERKTPQIILQLRAAKEHSDNRRYDQKNHILRQLMSAAPHDWIVDDPKPYHMGVTHSPTKFRFHADPQIIPPVVPVMAKAAANPYLDQLTQTPITYDKNKSVPANIFGHLRRVKRQGDKKIELDRNTQSWRATLDPAYRHRLNLAIARGEMPQPDATTRLIQSHGDRVLDTLSGT
jgi:ADP-ribose pyrophosphatase YjhB (NUDIX family)/shikimate kinase